jgi:hypothetical protein
VAHDFQLSPLVTRRAIDPVHEAVPWRQARPEIFIAPPRDVPVADSPSLTPASWRPGSGPTIDRGTAALQPGYHWPQRIWPGRDAACGVEGEPAIRAFELLEV